MARPRMSHVYLSTACLHGIHEHCQAKTNVEGEPKIPATCKWCSAPCVCECHGHMLVSSAAFVVPETSEGVAADNLQQQLDELERPYERTLSDGDGDLG